ncbi:MAG: peptidylprolyl isomerase, partial [Gemmatimonadota bacterium]
GGTDLRAVPILLQLVRDPEPRVRALAVAGLRVPAVDSVVRRLEVVASLTAALTDAHPHVRINAVRSLSAFREPGSAASITVLLRDPDPNVVLATVEAMANYGLAAADLRTLARDPARSVALRSTALNSLLRSDTSFVASVAREWTAAAGWLQRLYGVRLLIAVARTQPVQNELRRAVEDQDARVAAAALQAVAADTTNPPYALFIEKLADRDPHVRAAATRGLQRRRSPSDLEPLLRAYERALQDTPRVALQAAINALGALAQRGVPVANSFFLRFRKPADPLVHQSVVNQLGAGDWGPLKLNEPGRAPEYYRSVAHRYLNPDSTCARPRVRIRMAIGAIVLELLPSDAPLTVINFLTLAERGYFNGSRWHRVVPNFVLQDGEPRGDGSGSPGYSIRDEINRLRYSRGAVGMALSGPNTGGSQFFITHSPQPHLDGGYTIFGFVVEGMNVADAVTLDDPIIAIEVIR